MHEQLLPSYVFRSICGYKSVTLIACRDCYSDNVVNNVSMNSWTCYLLFNNWISVYQRLKQGSEQSTHTYFIGPSQWARTYRSMAGFTKIAHKTWYLALRSKHNHLVFIINLTKHRQIALTFHIKMGHPDLETSLKKKTPWLWSASELEISYNF
jgi:hypothetical protein